MRSGEARHGGHDRPTTDKLGLVRRRGWGIASHSIVGQQREKEQHAACSMQHYWGLSLGDLGLWDIATSALVIVGAAPPATGETPCGPRSVNDSQQATESKQASNVRRNQGS